MKEEFKEMYSVTFKLPLLLLCGVTVARRTMATPRQWVRVDVWYAETKSFITLQRNYRRVRGGDARGTKTITVWFDWRYASECYRRESNSRCVLENSQWTHPSSVEGITCTAYDKAPSSQLAASFVCTMLILRRNWRRTARKSYWTLLLACCNESMWIPASFQVSCFLTRLRFTSRENSIGTTHGHGAHKIPTSIDRWFEIESPKGIAWCGLGKVRIIRSFFVTEVTVKGGIYLDVLEQFVFS